MASVNAKDRGVRPRTNSNMRKSCHFCRFRKIRCSGQSICGACHDRKIDCVYGVEASKGRPKGSSMSAASRSGVTKNAAVEDKIVSPPELSALVATRNEGSGSPTVQDFYSSSSKASFAHFDVLMGRTRKSSISPPPHDLVRQGDTVSDNNGLESTVGVALEINFRAKFVDINTKSLNSCAKAYSNFAERSDSYVTPDGMDFESHSAMAGSSDRRTMKYDQMISLLAPDLIESLATRIDSLTDAPSAHSRFYAASLESDKTKSMFDPPPVDHETDPLNKYDDNQTTQMIEVWFSQHPLSSIVSKTLLLRSYKNGTHDKALLSVILADACMILEEPGAKQRSEQLFNWACCHIKDRPSFPVGIPICQTFMLLGWRELCQGHGRRATCFIGYSSCLIIQLQKDLASMQTVSLGQINGIIIVTVELEIVWNMYWLAFALTVWAFIQMDQPITELLPNKTPTIFPPIDAKSSAIIKLDIASNNVSTLLPQRRAMRELWPLSHISSTVAYIYALHPQTRATTEKKQPVEWQSQLASKFRVLLSPKEEVLDICSNIRVVLAEALQGLEAQESAPSAGVLSMAYLIVSMHTLFNHLEPNQFTETPIDAETLDAFYTNSCALIGIFNSYVQAQDNGGEVQGRDGLKCSITPLLVVAGLTVCGKVLKYVKIRMQVDSTADAGIIENKRSELLEMTTELLHFAREEPSLPAKRLRMVKKDLKQVKNYLNSTSMNSVLLSRVNSVLLSRVNSSSTFDFDHNMNSHWPSLQRSSTDSSIDNMSTLDSPARSVPTPVTSYSTFSKGTNAYVNSCQELPDASILDLTGIPVTMTDDGSMVSASPNTFINGEMWMNLPEAWSSTDFIPLESSATKGWSDGDSNSFDSFAVPAVEFGNLPLGMDHNFDTGGNIGSANLDGRAPGARKKPSMTF
ncbi:hypothetical protein V494_01545 [Pseudogymnoascus sp. VKM F-4513 (FW-928)]|nr:hypothetical protein V494_01545 [Pseudogymnoascus sp. VKM F-4513 (FW-928)]